MVLNSVSLVIFFSRGTVKSLFSFWLIVQCCVWSECEVNCNNLISVSASDSDSDSDSVTMARYVILSTVATIPRLQQQSAEAEHQSQDQVKGATRKP